MTAKLIYTVHFTALKSMFTYYTHHHFDNIMIVHCRIQQNIIIEYRIDYTPNSQYVPYVTVTSILQNNDTEPVILNIQYN